MARKIVVKRQRIVNPQKAIITKQKRNWNKKNKEFLKSAKR